MLLDPRDPHSAIVGHQRWSAWDMVRFGLPFFIAGMVITGLIVWALA